MPDPILSCAGEILLNYSVGLSDHIPFAGRRRLIVYDKISLAEYSTLGIL
ncbi:MAG: hypothetical protein IKC87_04895 [Clostridia bacterium]|nr:hypothetical protein [Clostridia bacterium]